MSDCLNGFKCQPVPPLAVTGSVVSQWLQDVNFLTVNHFS